MTHRGEVLERAVRESGMPITVLAKRLGKSRRHIYDLFQQAQVPVDTLVEIGKIIHHDFSEELPQLIPSSAYFQSVTVMEPIAPYEVDKNADYWKNKYLVLLEKYNALLEEVKGK
jgi:iron-sulfur cluster repair protein YtfE (RIC family)